MRKRSRGVTRASEPEPLKNEGPEMPPHTVALVLDGNDLLVSVYCSQSRRECFLR